jgi:glycosyltransferase involved in cell wall biosynthesis
MMKKTKIAIFHLAFIYSGGGERLVLKQADLLKKYGHNVEIYTSVIDEHKCFPDIIRKYKIRTFISPYIFRKHESFKIILSCILFPFIAYKFRSFDCILAANQPSLWMGYVLKKIYKIPYVGYLAQPTRFFYPRKIDKETGLFFVKKEVASFSVVLMRLFWHIIKKLDSLSVRNANLVLTNGKYITEQIKKIYKIQTENCPAGADTRLIPISSKIKSAKHYILMTNRQAWQKRFEYGLTAYSGLLTENPNYELWISGKFTDYTEELKVMVARLGLTDKVKFLGYVKEKELKSLYSNATVYLYTAPEEDFGMGIVDAMGQGVPVIAWDSAGPGKIIVNGRTGYLIKDGDLSDFTKKLIKLVQNKNLNSKMGKNAIELIKNQYSWKQHLSLITKSFLRTNQNPMNGLSS